MKFDIDKRTNASDGLGDISGKLQADGMPKDIADRIEIAYKSGFNNGWNQALRIGMVLGGMIGILMVVAISFL
jgi:hypothetical protein